MAFPGFVLKAAMDLLSGGFTSGAGATAAYSKNPVKDKVDTSKASAIAKLNYQTAQTLVNFMTYLNTLTPADLLAAEMDATDLSDIITAFGPSVDLWGTLVTGVEATERMATHTEHVVKNLPVITKKAGTVTALRSVTDTAPDVDCDQDGQIVAAITETPKPTNTSPISEVAGTLTEGEDLQEESFTRIQTLEERISPSMASILNAFIEFIFNTISTPAPTPNWVDDSLILLADFNNKLLTDPWVSAAQVAVLAVNEQSTTIATKVNSERVTAGFPDTDGTALTHNGITVNPGPADEVQVAAGGATAEIRTRAYGVQAATLTPDPCMKEINEKFGGSEIATESATVTTTLVTAEVPNEIEEPVEEFVESPNPGIRERILLQLENVLWASPAFEMFFKQSRVTSNVQVGVGVTISGVDHDTIYSVPSEQIYDTVPVATEEEIINFGFPYEIYPNPANEAGKEVLSGLVSHIKSNLGSVISANKLNVWLTRSPRSGEHSIHIFGPQTLVFHGAADCVSGCTNLEGKTSISFSGRERNVVDFLRDYVNALETEKELLAFETNVLPSILP